LNKISPSIDLRIILDASLKPLLQSTNDVPKPIDFLGLQIILPTKILAGHCGHAGVIEEVNRVFELTRHGVFYSADREHRRS
jgi:hypothetical protein